MKALLLDIEWNKQGISELCYTIHNGTECQNLELFHINCASDLQFAVGSLVKDLKDCDCVMGWHPHGDVSRILKQCNNYARLRLMGVLPPIKCLKRQFMGCPYLSQQFQEWSLNNLKGKVSFSLERVTQWLLSNPSYKQRHTALSDVIDLVRVYDILQSEPEL